MSFASFTFWACFAAVLLAYALLTRRHGLQNWLLLGFSYVFYGAWDWRFLSLIMLSTAVDFVAGQRIHDAVNAAVRKRWLLLSLVINLGLLGVFKYLGFFADSFEAFAGTLGWSPGPITLSIVLPVGISFYTFQTLSYTIDIYRGDLKPSRRLRDFALFVAFFPQLVAGPIERARNLLPNVERPRTIVPEQFYRGVYLCLFGLMKKVAIGDGLAGPVGSVFEAPDPSGTAIWIASFLFAIQIYCDFSGYTDIARGLSKMLGFELMRNFRMPYFSTGPQEFWRRWHISLSTWLRDYLYISLGGNRGGTVLMYRNLMLTMIIGGLWHGARWNFVLWGFYQGALLVCGRLIGPQVSAMGRRLTPDNAIGAAAQGLGGSAATRAAGRVAASALFFLPVCYGWMLFRATTLDQVASFTAKMVTPASLLAAPVVANPPLAALAGIAFLFVHDLAEEASSDPRPYMRLPRVLRGAVYASLVTLLLMGLQNGSTEFIYFQF